MTNIPFIHATFLGKVSDHSVIFTRLQSALISLRAKAEIKTNLVRPDADAQSDERGDARASISDEDRAKLHRRARKLHDCRVASTGLTHLKKEELERLEVFREGVKLVRIATEARADEIAASLHEEMPWMAPVTERIWYEMRRSVRNGDEGLRLRPLLLDGPPGIGKSHWARRLGGLIGAPSTVIEATSENASFGIVGGQRGWGSAQPGRLLQTIMSHRVANPVIVVDEEDVSDPNQVYTLHARLVTFGVLDAAEIDRFIQRFLGANKRADERPILEGIVRQAVTRFNENLNEEDQEEFRQVLASFLRFYSFIAQVVNLGDTDLEKLHVYGSWLKRILPTRQTPQGEDVTDDMLELEAYRLERQGEPENASLGADANQALTPIDRFGANPFTEEEAVALTEIIQAFNSRHGTEFSEEDYIRFEAVNEDILGDEAWAEMLRNNDPRDVRPRYDAEFMRRSIRAFQRDNAMRNAFMQDQEARDMLMGLMFRRAVRGAGRAA